MSRAISKWLFVHVRLAKADQVRPYTQSLCLIDSQRSVHSTNGQRRLWSAWAYAQADLSRRCPHMLEDNFSYGIGQLCKCTLVPNSISIHCHMFKCGSTETFTQSWQHHFNPLTCLISTLFKKENKSRNGIWNVFVFLRKDKI